MPIYQCISPEGLLDESARGKLAEEITRIHCDATGVPPSFVNIMFLDMPDGRYFVAGRPSTHSVLNGAIRVGRDLETRQREKMDTYVKAPMPVISRPTMRACMVSVPSKVWIASMSTMCRITW